MTAPITPRRQATLPAMMSAELTGRLGPYTERLGWDASQLAHHQRERLRLLLAHAAGHSPFHARRLRGLDPSRFELADLPRLPVMTKAEMMAQFDAVATDRRLSKHQVEQHLAASAREPSLLLDEYVCLASGGSSGLRGVFVQGAADLSRGLGLPVPGGLIYAGHAGATRWPSGTSCTDAKRSDRRS